MNVRQPGKIGKIGYLLALMSVFLSLPPILDLFGLKLTLWDVPFLVIGGFLMVLAYILASKDAYMRRLGWGLVMWRPITIRDRLAVLFVLVGGLWIVVVLSALSSPSAFYPWGNDWLVTLVAGLVLLVGWALVLTGRDDASSAQENSSDISVL